MFEQMQWLCFHIVFEYDGDPDEPGRDPACPQWQIEIFRLKLEQLGFDPDEVIL